MSHGDKTNAFLGELEDLYRKYNVSLAFDPAKLKFVIQDLNGAIPANFRDNIVDESVHRVAVPSEGLSKEGEAEVEPTNDSDKESEEVLEEEPVSDSDYYEPKTDEEIELEEERAARE